jgi:hypothetical protein
MPTLKKSLLAQYGNAKIIEQWPEDGLELAFFAEYLSKFDQDNLSQDAKEYLRLTLTFFSSPEYLKVKHENLSYLNSSELTKTLYPKIIEKMLTSNFKKPDRVTHLLVTEVDKFFIRKSRTHDITIAYLVKIKNSELSARNLAEKLGHEANILIAYFLQQEAAVFVWPLLDAKLLQSDVICRLTVTGKISLNELAKLDHGSIAKIRHFVVASYLKYLLSLERRIPPLADILSLDHAQIELYPLVANHTLTVAQANAYPIDTLGREILSQFIHDANWKDSTFDFRRLIFINNFIQTPLFIKLQKSINTINVEINKLKLEQASMITESGIKKANELGELKTELIAIISSHLQTLYPPDKVAEKPKRKHSELYDEETEEKYSGVLSIDIDENTFNKNLNQAIHTKIHTFIREKSICEHRNYFSKFLKTILDGLTWVFKPLLDEEYRYRLFTPKSAKTLFAIEDNLQVNTPRCGNVA